MKNEEIMMLCAWERSFTIPDSNSIVYSMMKHSARREVMQFCVNFLKLSEQVPYL